MGPLNKKNLPIVRDIVFLRTYILNELGQISPTHLHLHLSEDISVEAKNSGQSARQRRGLSAPRHHRLRYHINDVGLLAPLSSSLDYGHLLNYFSGDKSILQSQADGHLAHCNRPLSLVSL